MGKVQIILLALLAVGMAALMLATWGSIGSAALTLGLLLGGIFTAMKKSMDRDNDFDMYDAET